MILGLIVMMWPVLTKVQVRLFLFTLCLFLSLVRSLPIFPVRTIAKDVYNKENLDPYWNISRSELDYRSLHHARIGLGNSPRLAWLSHWCHPSRFGQVRKLQVIIFAYQTFTS